MEALKWLDAALEVKTYGAEKMFMSVIAGLGATFAALTWVAWRYFFPARSDATGHVERGRLMRVVSPEVPDERRAFPGLAFDRVATLRMPLVIAIALVGLSAAFVLALSGRITLDPLTVSHSARQQHIYSALSPEALVPPPPLPPSVFIGTGRPGLESANRDWSLLNREFAAAVLKVFARLEARGYPFVLLEGYRAPERQDALADSGAGVTNARAFQSKHQFGLALDAAPLRGGRLIISEKDPWAMEAYAALGEEAERAGLTWGGRWRLRDYGHIEVSGTAQQYAASN